MANAVLKGYGGDVTIGATALRVKEWSGDFEAEDIDTTTKASGAWREADVGIQQLSGTVTGQWQSEVNSSAPPFALVKPQSGVAMVLRFGANVSMGKYTFTATINKMSIKSAVEGAIEYTFEYKSSGEVVYATSDA